MRYAMLVFMILMMSCGSITSPTSETNGDDVYSEPSAIYTCDTVVYQFESPTQEEGNEFEEGIEGHYSCVSGCDNKCFESDVQCAPCSYNSDGVNVYITSPRQFVVGVVGQIGIARLNGGNGYVGGDIRGDYSFLVEGTEPDDDKFECDGELVDGRLTLNCDYLIFD